MDVRTKLIGMLDLVTKWYRFDAWENTDKIVDYLLANGVTVQKWIPVSERLPDNNNPVLVYCTNTTINGGYITHIGSLDSGRYWFLRAEPGIATFPVREWQVTHWMPLPEPPKEGL